ncbi:EAL domain-containing protein [Brevundimonas sp.]|uniref:EAL domain-containing protein n=1 Tax=Brevundimonas sp. TaxID=1871086 RepID=UPI002C2555B8|nr:EAL domain-containing protein [Brevundimonas sp.]HWQ86597.1 EAL domain-containing protein [Brevundimonas sp.]
MNTKSRLLGLAFASADILIELDQEGRIVLAIGSPPAPDCAAPESWPGRHLLEFFGKASRAAFDTAVEGLAVGVRSPTAEVLLICDEDRVRRARIRAFRLPELAPALSCAITFEGSPFSLTVPQSPPLLTGDGFLERARATLDKAAARGPMAIAFVDVSGLDSVAGERGQRATARVQAALQTASIDGSSATRLSPERFALLKDGADGRDLATEVREAAAAEGLDLSSRATEAPIAVGADPVSILKALRFTIEGCLRDGGLDRPEQAFSEALKNTLRDASRFRVMVKARQFALHYQPIVDLRTGVVHHFEALARFGDTAPANVIHMAEELGLIEEFDLAALEKVVRKIRQPGNGLIKVAVNVSGASLATDAYVNALLHLTAADPGERRRLMIEVTETAALADIDAADRRLRALRRSGVKVCIDDFGAGSATFDYLRGLSVDSVKIDGNFIRDLEADQRVRTVVTHLVELCASLNLTTIAEMVETEAVAELVGSMGVDYGQGWHFGRPTPQPVTAQPDRSRGAPRRLGAVSSWG